MGGREGGKDCKVKAHAPLFVNNAIRAHVKKFSTENSTVEELAAGPSEM
jgi:hypothetical protein